MLSETKETRIRNKKDMRHVCFSGIKWRRLIFDAGGWMALLTLAGWVAHGTSLLESLEPLSSDLL